MFSERSTSRWRRWGVWIALGWLIVLGLAGGRWWYQERIEAKGREDLATAIAETNRLDPRWHWEQIEADRPAVADAENSMRVIHEIADSLGGWVPEGLKLSDGEEFWNDEPSAANRQLDDERLALIRQTLKERKRSLELAVSLKDFPRGRQAIEVAPDFVSILLPHVQNCRPAYRLLELDIERLLHWGRPQEAADYIPAILNATAGLRDEPFLISQLVRIAGRSAAVRRTERILGMGELGEDKLKDLMTAFKREQNQNPMLIGIRGERAGHHILFENLESGRVPLADAFFGQPSPTGDLAAFLYKSRLCEDHAFMLRRLNEACVISQLPWHEQMAASREWEKRLSMAKVEAMEQKRLVLSYLLLPAIDMLSVTTLRDQAYLCCVLTAIAAERFRLAHQRWPQNLQELCPKYLSEVPIDPFDGKPLRLAKKKDGIAIYSVWKDGRDGGGEILNPYAAGGKNADLGLRLWDPKQRRLPAEPRKKDEEKGPDDDEVNRRNGDAANPR